MRVAEMRWRRMGVRTGGNEGGREGERGRREKVREWRQEEGERGRKIRV